MCQLRAIEQCALSFPVIQDEVGNIGPMVSLETQDQRNNLWQATAPQLQGHKNKTNL